MTAGRGRGVGCHLDIDYNECDSGVDSKVIDIAYGGPRARFRYAW